jgi:hypothetical protein
MSRGNRWPDTRLSDSASWPSRVRYDEEQRGHERTEPPYAIADPSLTSQNQQISARQPHQSAARQVRFAGQLN